MGGVGFADITYWLIIQLGIYKNCLINHRFDFYKYYNQSAIQFNYIIAV